MSKPIIGISGSIIVDEGGMFPGYKRAYVNDDYVQAVASAGGIPYIIPIVDDEELVISQLSMIDGLLMSGGQDINPLMYGEEPNRLVDDIFPRRDTFDERLVKNFMKTKKPIFGICRGHQIINVVNGGTLHQDLTLIKGSYIKHWQAHNPSYETHSVLVEKDSRLHDILGDETLVNSFHHLAIKDVAPGFKVTAKAKDGVIEGIEKVGDEFVVGIQWHSEMLSATNEKMHNIFVKFVGLCAKNKK